MSVSPAKIGLIGVGTMGRKHLSKFLAYPNAEVVGFHDPDIRVIKTIRDEFGLIHFEKLDDLIFESDGVVIASPTETHYTIAKRALEAGAHVLIEKPLAETSRQAEELIEIARRNKLAIQVGHLERFRFLALQKHFALGPIRFFQSMRLASILPREEGIDVISDLMVHDLDLLVTLIPSEPVSIQAQAFSFVSSSFDIVDVWIAFPDGSAAHLKASRLEREAHRKLRLCGDRGVVSLDLLSNEIEVRGKTLKVIPAQSIDALKLQCASFIESILGGSTPVVNGEEALRSLRLCEAIRRSVVSNGMRVQGATTLAVE